MRYAEKQLKGGYKYWTVDDEVFGKMIFKAPEKLTAEYLDLLVGHLLKTQSEKGEIKVEIKGKGSIQVKYAFKRKPDWGKPETIKINITKDE